MDNFADIFNDDAFGLVALTASFSNIDHVPGQAGALTFAGNGKGSPTTDALIESRDQVLSIIPTTERGAPAPQEVRDKAKVIKLHIPQIKLEDSLHAHSLQNVRAFGSGDLIAGAQQVVNDQLTKMASRLDLTLESMRLSALKGRIVDADGTVLTDLYTEFGIAEPDAVVFPSNAMSEASSLRTACQDVSRRIKKAAKTLLTAKARVWALCGDGFFDQLVNHPDVATVFSGWEAAQHRLAEDATQSPFVFGGIAFENYRGTDGVTGNEANDAELIGEVGIASEECRIFLTGVDGLYVEHFAPADFMEFVNAVGLPRYAKTELGKMGRLLTLHVQSNPLPVCTRPATLLKGHFG